MAGFYIGSKVLVHVQSPTSFRPVNPCHIEAKPSKSFNRWVVRDHLNKSWLINANSPTFEGFEEWERNVPRDELPF